MVQSLCLEGDIPLDELDVTVSNTYCTCTCSTCTWVMQSMFNSVSKGMSYDTCSCQIWNNLLCSPNETN